MPRPAANPFQVGDPLVSTANARDAAVLDYVDERAGAPDTSRTRVVRGVRYVPKTGVNITDPFDRDDYTLDVTANPAPRAPGIKVTGHSWGDDDPARVTLLSTNSHWSHRVADVIAPAGTLVNHARSGGAAANWMGGFPCDGQTGRLLQNLTAQNGDPATVNANARELVPTSPAQFGLLGYNDPVLNTYYQATDGRVVFRAAYEAYTSARRLVRYYTPQSSEITYTPSANWTADTSVNTMTMGTGGMYTNYASGALLSFQLPPDYEGECVAVFFYMNGAYVNYAMQPYVNGVVHGPVFDTNALHTARGLGSPASGGNPGGGVFLTGVHRITTLDASDAGQIVDLLYYTYSGAFIGFAGVGIEGPVPILDLQVPTVPASIGGGNTASINTTNVEQVNQDIRTVLDTFPANSVAFAELPSDAANNPFNDPAAWRDVGDVHLSSYGHQLYSEYVYDALRASPYLTPTQMMAVAA